MVKKVEEAVNSFSNNVSQELYMEALKSGINMAESRKKETDLSGSWLVRVFTDCIHLVYVFPLLLHSLV